MSELRRHIMMQAQGGSRRIIGIGGDGVAQIVIPTAIPTNYRLNDINLFCCLYAEQNKRSDATLNIFLFNRFALAIGMSAISGSSYNYLRVAYTGYAFQNYLNGLCPFGIEYQKIEINFPTCTSFDNDGNVYSTGTMAPFLGVAPVGGDIVMTPTHFVSRISAPGYFDLVAAEEGGRLGFYDTLSGTFYGQTNSEGELVALYEE